MKKKSSSAAWLILAALASLALTATAGSGADQNTDHWVGTWATAPLLLVPPTNPNAPAAPIFKDTTLRQVVHVSIGGPSVRVRFSNAFGTTPLVISSAHVAVPAGGGAIRADSDKALTFGGQSSVTIPAGAPMYSDALDFNLAALSDLTITIHVAEAPEGTTMHGGSNATSYLQSGDEVSAADMTSATHVEHWYFLDGVDVQSSRAAGAVVAFGDSITDGAHSTANANSRWPDDLARRLAANKKTAGVGVLNEGIGGNRILHDMTGPNALARFDRDVLAQSGVRWLIILEGINDLGAHGRAVPRNETIPTAQELIAAYQQIILRAHTHHIRVYGATILPYQGANYFSAEGEADRETINKWIRTSGAFDAVIDLDAATRDPQKPTQFAPSDDSGDHLHPGDAGYKAMADAIDLKLFLK
ncbi:MAG: SGNH/GDSL hydrolase family protein [Candidatus Acidiferrales bacterium]